MEKVYRSFFISNKGYFFVEKYLPDNCEYEILLGFSKEDQEEKQEIGEIYVRWYHLSNNKVYPKFEAFSDSWFILKHLKDLFESMNDLEHYDITPDEFVYTLLNLGFKDETRYKENYQENEAYHKILNRKRKIGIVID